ncbi:LysR substrate-binding domain-containing protein [Orrella sp. JC864]|uniref:LysR substrate-binding domain-containing protein n=1 Tax=Orrella sp. JC864 TaxID=3120298 RepID=UPI0012BBCE51
MTHTVPSLAALQAFEASARLGSFSRAAEELALTHSAVYRQVAGLEARLGVALFTRVRRRIVPTAAGLEYAGRIRHHLEQIERDTASLVSQAAMGRNLEVAVFPTLATTWLVPKLTDFQRLHPDITVSLSLRTQPFQFKDHPFDAAIYQGEHLWAGTQGCRLFPEKELVPVCAPAALAAGRAPSGLPAGMVHLHLSTRPDAWRDWYAAHGHDGAAAAAAGPRYELFTMVLAAAAAGLGVGLVPRFLAEGPLARGELCIPVEQPLPVPHAYFFAYPLQRPKSEALGHFESWLSAVARQAVPR